MNEPEVCRPSLGQPVTASGYMVRYSTMRQWRERNPTADYYDQPLSGVKTWKREGAPFSGVFVGLRRLTIKCWRFSNNDPDDRDYHCRKFPITLWLIAYSTRAKPRYVLPRDVICVAAEGT